MPISPFLRRTLPAALLAGATAIAISAPSGAAQPAHAAAAAAAKITAGGVGGVKLGDTYTSLRSRHLVGKLVTGCPLAGRQARSALLTAPLKGDVDFTLSSPRRVTAITVTGGARARGVGIGASLAAIKRVYPKVVVDHSGESTFGTTFVRVPKGAGGKLEFGIDVKTKKVVVMGVPYIATCE